jgi:hypothetical protein
MVAKVIVDIGQFEKFFERIENKEITIKILSANTYLWT